MTSVLIVSKPLVPPWNDSSKNLARDVAQNLARYRARTFERAGDGKRQVLTRLVLDDAALVHFFFAPNPRTSGVAKLVTRARRRLTVQTVCSRPRDMTRAARWLFADRTIVLSRATRDAMLGAGLAEDRIRYIRPAVPALVPLDAEARHRAREAFGLPPDRFVVVFPGDLEFGDGAERMVRAFAGTASTDAILVMACRPKTPLAKEREIALRRQADTLGITPRVVWVGETPRIHDLLGSADVVALPSTDLYAKMDLPLVLIEAMRLERAVLVLAGSPAAELADEDAAYLAEPSDRGCAAGLDALRDDALRRGFGERARAAASVRYDPGSMVRAYEDLYDELLRP